MKSVEGMMEKLKLSAAKTKGIKIGISTEARA